VRQPRVAWRGAGVKSTLGAGTRSAHPLQREGIMRSGVGNGITEREGRAPT